MRGKAISGATAVLILAFFFLPWVSVSYYGHVLGQFSGYQLAVGAGEYALDGLNGRSVLFLIPLSALVIFIVGRCCAFQAILADFCGCGGACGSAVGTTGFAFADVWARRESCTEFRPGIRILVDVVVFLIGYGGIGSYYSGNETFSVGTNSSQ